MQNVPDAITAFTATTITDFGDSLFPGEPAVRPAGSESADLLGPIDETRTGLFRELQKRPREIPRGIWTCIGAHA